MNVTLISVIVALAVLILKMEFSSKRINDFMTFYDKSLSDLAKAEQKRIIDEKQHNNAANEINKYYKDFTKGYVGYVILKLIKPAEWLKNFLPMLLIFEVLHITLQEFGWSGFYDGRYPGLNKLYVVIIILFIIFIMFVHLAFELFMSDKKIRDLESKIASVIARYIYDML
ncbi:MAG: hypothetical protein FIB07_13520 [Candidatus Methanoperedens sp.]|nr:hypothetical protein [Candidatus Methanoperedens sp.]